MLFKRKVEDKRGKILAHIREASNYLNCLNPNSLLDRMNWMESELNLNNLSLNIDEQKYYASLKSYISGKEESQLTDRQIHCFVFCMDLINGNEYSMAYHELYDFIYDYGSKDGKPLSNYEVKGIKLLAEAMKTGIITSHATY